MTKPQLAKRNYLLLMVMLYMAAFISCDVLIKRMIGFNNLYTSGAIVGFPLTFTIADIVAEVYGYQIARNMLWFAFAGDFLFDMLATLTIHLPYPSYWHSASDFKVALSGLPTLFLISFLTAPVSDFFNIYVLVKTKILFKGRYFILIGAQVFSLAFRGLNGEELIAKLFNVVPGGLNSDIWLMLPLYRDWETDRKGVV